MAQKKKFGDRRDGTRIKVAASARLMTYTKDRRDADVYINRKIDCTKLVEYMEQKKKEVDGLTYFHAFSIAIAKVLYNRPKLNRFITNHKFYQRNEVSLAFACKVDFSDEAKELMAKIKIEENDNLFTLKDKIRNLVSAVRSNVQTGSDSGVDALDKIPDFLLKWVIMPVLLWMDKHDLLPASFVNDMLYYSSVIISNLGSIKCGAIYHNIVDFGTNSILLTVGDIHKEPVVDENGNIVVHDVVEVGVTMDERIGDGVYFSKAINMYDYILQHPELLEEPANAVIEEKKDFTY